MSRNRVWILPSAPKEYATPPRRKIAPNQYYNHDNCPLLKRNRTPPCAGPTYEYKFKYMPPGCSAHRKLITTIVVELGKAQGFIKPLPKSQVSYNQPIQAIRSYAQGFEPAVTINLSRNRVWILPSAPKERATPPRRKITPNQYYNHDTGSIRI